MAGTLAVAGAFEPAAPAVSPAQPADAGVSAAPERPLVTREDAARLKHTPR
jgi:hypothetical protein